MTVSNLELRLGGIVVGNCFVPVQEAMALLNPTFAQINIHQLASRIRWSYNGDDTSLLTFEFTARFTCQPILFELRTI